MAKSAKFETVGDYLAAQPPAGRAVLEEIRTIARAELPDAEERLSYAIPTFFVAGRRVVHLAGWARHVSLYPVPGPTHDDPTLGDDLGAYVAGRGTLRFALDEPLPVDVVRRVVRALARAQARST